MPHNNSKVWIISKGRSSDIDLDRIFEGDSIGPCKEYKISAIGRYLLNPDSIEIKKKLIGGEIHHKQGPLKKMRKAFHKILPGAEKRLAKNLGLSPEVIVSRYKLQIPPLKDSHLERHLNQIVEQLRPYDSVAKKLVKLDPRKIVQIVGICEDVGGNYSYLKLQGSIEEKIKYLGKFISKDVGVILNKAYIADGLFELRGYDFFSHDPAKTYKLITYNSGGDQKACVLTENDKIDFYLKDCHLLKQMHLLEQSLKSNPSFSQAFNLCLEGQATPIKLFFNQKLEIDYSKAALPEFYQDVFKTLNVELNKKTLIQPILNHLQIGISLSYIMLSDRQQARMHTDVSVLHDLRALEPLRKNLPHVYSAVVKQATVSEAGNFYLLDSINGYSNA
ncbi:MAG: hypothetical protein V2I56_00240 [Desulfobacteraceae bacterium]|jgi:hypothetical protein|nr:hypothetical protein [Desulfobacteraceae bacterium]